MACNERSIGFLLNRAARTYSHFIETLMADENHPISHEQFTLLMELFKEDNVSQQELACRCFRGKTSITRLLGGLEGKEYVVRCQAKDDKRKRMVRLTPKGRDAHATMKRIAESAACRASENLDAKTMDALRDGLEQVFANTKHSCETHLKSTE